MTDDITALLFCGGRGSRLYPVTDYYQKVMMPIGKDGRPMLEYVINWLKYQGVKKFIALIRYRANQIRRYFGDGSNWGIEIKYVLDDPKYQGTGGALLNVKAYISTKTMLVYYTDILSNFNLQNMYDFHIQQNKIGTTFLDPDWKVSESIIQISDNHYITSVSNELVGETFVNTGISLFQYSIFEVLEKLLAMKENENQDVICIDLSADLFPILATRELISAYLSTDWWLDVGSINRHQLLSENLLIDKFGDVVQL